jgi:transcriptional regulator with XRE-family HTH domain
MRLIMGKKSSRVNLFGNVFMTLGERLREERERLGKSQPVFAAIADTTKQTLFSWESGKTAPDGFQLAALAAAGTDVLYVITGSRDPELPALDTSERLLIDNYRRCGSEGRAHLVQTSALLAAGMGAPNAPAAQPRGSVVKVSARGGHAAGRDMTISNNTPGRTETDGSAKGGKPVRPRGRP